MATETTWEGLFQHALRLVDEIHTHGSKHLTWTFGGREVVIVELDAAAISVAE